MFNWMRNSCNKTVSSLSKYEQKSDISEFSSLMKSNQTIVTDEDQATSDESMKKVLRSALKKPKNNDINDLESIEKTPKKVTFLLDDKYIKKHRKRSKLSKRYPTKRVSLDEEESDNLNEVNSDEVVAACKRKFQTLRSKNKPSSPPISSCASFDSLEFLEDDTKIKEFDFNESKENETFINRLFNISSKNNKIIEYIYKKAKALTKPFSRTSQNETSEQSEETENKPLIDHAADNHNDDTFLDDEFINHIEHNTSENLGNTTTESTVGKLLFGVNLNYQTTFNDMYELFHKEKCS
ncbi:hypothetical protein HZH66_005795 [Vespula vulgaris]|uniref:Uncharacterized protein n=1 Tax=Vespula vulgaris TaxID=7454 RepID=A0A834K5T7_VESVU|nr:hypothetical protein HZH66_005795 [Vespula vulgaris]